MSISAWLEELGLERYVEAFEAHDIDTRTLPLLTESDLADIGVKSIGHRRKLADAIAALRTVPATPESTSATPADTPGAVSAKSGDAMAEHRQLTVLYCDMVGSTALSARLDPEELREVIRAFHEAGARAMAEFDGHEANFIGDCMLAYFGWPHAHEDDPERAVRAGLAMVRVLGGLLVPGGTVAVRISVATGDVLVGDLIREGPAREQCAIGVAPSVTAQLQSLAAPGQVVIDDLTRQLLPSSFALQPLGHHALKGISEPVAAYAVVGERPVDSRFDARNGQELTPMIGRDQELALLVERWAQACAGEAQGVLLVGEAGIGKSRLTRALLDACAREPHRTVRWQCSPYHSGSALWPVTQRLRRASGLDADDPNDASLDKLEALIGTDNAEASALYATLLGLDGTHRYGPLELTPQMLRERTLELLLEQLLDMARERPLLLVVEDAHWIDPSTRELIERCLERIGGARLLILITSRPDNQPQLGAHPSVSRLSLNRLSRASVQVIVTKLGGARLNPRTLATIASRADGVPLFVEELTKAVLEIGEAAIPASLHGSLMVRLDRISEVKDVAQIAACIGREFDQALVQAVAERPDAVEAALDKLAGAELVFRRGGQANPRYTFKHALVQEAAYESLLRGKRQHTHARILEVLQTQRQGTASEILAHHAECSGQFDRAIGLWTEAGNAALGKSAYAEAAGYLTNAIKLVQAQPECRERRARELELHLRLGLANMAYLGFPAHATRTALARADELLDADSENTHYYPVQYGLWAGQISRGEFGSALRLANKVLVTAQSDGTDQALLFAHRIVGTSHMYLGEFANVRPHFDQALQYFDPNSKQRGLAKQFSVDPGAAVHCCYGFALAIMGLAAQSRSMLEHAHAIGSGLPQASARAYTFYQLAITGAVLGDPVCAKANAEIAADLSGRHRLPMYLGTAQILLGWALLQTGCPAEEALPYHERGLAELTEMGSHVYVPIYMAWHATALAAAGRQAEAMRKIELAFDENEVNPQGWGDAELWRLRGALFLGGPQRDLAEAAACFESALRIARVRGAKLWELRAAVSLAQLWAGQGDFDRAEQLLGPTYDWFTEGFDTTDLVQARAVLAEVGGRLR